MSSRSRTLAAAVFVTAFVAQDPPRRIKGARTDDGSSSEIVISSQGDRVRVQLIGRGQVAGHFSRRATILVSRASMTRFVQRARRAHEGWARSGCAAWNVTDVNVSGLSPDGQRASLLVQCYRPRDGECDCDPARLPDHLYSFSIGYGDTFVVVHVPRFADATRAYDELARRAVTP